MYLIDPQLFICKVVFVKALENNFSTFNAYTMLTRKEVITMILARLAFDG